MDVCLCCLEKDERMWSVRKVCGVKCLCDKVAYEQKSVCDVFLFGSGGRHARILMEWVCCYMYGNVTPYSKCV